MIRINLLPIRQARKLESARRELSVLLVGGLFVLFASAGAWALTRAELANVEAQNRNLQSDIDRLAADVKKVDEMEKFKGELETKLAVISDLRTKKNGPVHMIDELGMATPDRLQLVTVTEKGGNLEIEGLSVSNEIISQFLRSLDASAYFDSVYLNNIEATTQNKDSPIPIKEFKVTARLVAPKVEDLMAEEVPPVDPATPPTGAPLLDGAAPAAPAGAAPATPAATGSGT